MSVYNLDKNNVLESDDIEHVKQAYKTLLIDADRYKRWFEDGQDRIDALEDELAEAKEMCCE